MKHFQIETDHGYSTPVITNLGDLATSESIQYALEMILPPAKDLGSGTKLNFTSAMVTRDDNMIYQFTFNIKGDFQVDVADLLAKHVQELDEPNVLCKYIYHQNILTFIIQFYY